MKYYAKILACNYPKKPMLKLFNLWDVLRITAVIVAALVVFIIMPFEDVGDL
jgi:antibiotic biosynthesis monooxygenase (ABM) superfamily enzyme